MVFVRITFDWGCSLQWEECWFLFVVFVRITFDWGCSSRLFYVLDDDVWWICARK